MKITNCTQLVNVITSFIINATDYLSTDFVFTNNNNNYHYIFLFFNKEIIKENKNIFFNILCLILTCVIFN